jgi:hypothetical protein
MAAGNKLQRAAPWWRCIKKQINWGAWVVPHTNKYIQPQTATSSLSAALSKHFQPTR